jgi:predicted nicotinamide N-methyase
MTCSDDIKAKVQQALRLPSSPVTHDTWAGGIYTCRYSLPMGEMTLSDHVFADAAAARAGMAAQQAADRTAHSLAGLGQQAYGSDRGLAVVQKDDQVLTVDTTGLPDRFGANDQGRADLAYEVASDVLGCWTGDE